MEIMEDNLRNIFLFILEPVNSPPVLSVLNISPIWASTFLMMTDDDRQKRKSLVQDCPCVLSCSSTFVHVRPCSSHLLARGVNHSLEISGNPCRKSEISYAWARNPFEKWEISYVKCWSDLALVLAPQIWFVHFNACSSTSLFLPKYVRPPLPSQWTWTSMDEHGRT